MSFGLGGGGFERRDFAAEQHELVSQAANDPDNIAREEALFEVRAERKKRREQRGRRWFNALRRLTGRRQSDT